MPHQEFKEGDWIMRQGEVGDCFYIVAEGEVAFYVRGELIVAASSNLTTTLQCCIPNESNSL